MGIDEGWLTQCFGQKKKGKSAPAIEKAAKTLQGLVLEEDDSASDSDSQADKLGPKTNSKRKIKKKVGPKVGPKVATNSEPKDKPKTKTRKRVRKMKIPPSPKPLEESANSGNISTRGASAPTPTVRGVGELKGQKGKVTQEEQSEEESEKEKATKKSTQSQGKMSHVKPKGKVVAKPEVDMWFAAPGRVLHKNLLVFDFDNTLLDYNTDIEIEALAEIPEDFRNVHNIRSRTQYMQELFKHFHRNGVTPRKIRDLLRTLTPTEGMINLIYHAKRVGYEIVVISDSNRVFVDFILETNGIADYVDKVFTNPAWFNESGLLQIKPYHDQNYCSLSSRNLCKGQILLDYFYERRLEGVEFDTVTYIGDGRKDICAMMKLRECDTAFVRRGYSLHKFVNEEMPYDPELRIDAQIFLWDNGEDIWKRLPNATGIKLDRAPISNYAY